MAFKELDGSGIHRLENILTLNFDARTFFDTLKLWLEPVEAVSNSPPLSIGTLTGLPGHTQHLQALCDSSLLYQIVLEVYCNIHNPGSRETSLSITSVYRASCSMLQGC
jgi:hypothetical protein